MLADETNTILLSRPITAEDIKPGVKFVMASVGAYLGPGMYPRISISETIFEITPTEPVHESGVLYVTKEGDDEESFLMLEEVLNGKEHPGNIRTTYWTYPQEIPKA